MIVLDASVVVAHLAPGDAHHDLAGVLLRDLAGDDLVMHPLNLAEVLVGGVRAGRGGLLLADLTAMGIRESRAPEDALRLATLRAETRLPLPDCCALDTALTLGAALATFDEQLSRAAHGRHVIVRPSPPTG